MSDKGTEMTWRLLTLDPGVNAVAAAGSGLYASAPSGLHRSRDHGASWQRLGDPVSVLAAAPDGIWSGTASEPGRPAALQFSADGEKWTSPQRLPVEARDVNELTVLGVAPSGEVWAALRQRWLDGSSPRPGLAQYAEVAADSVFRGARGRPFERVSADWARVTGIAFDSCGRTWISSSGGVSVDGRRVFEMAADGVAVDADDRVVISTCMSAYVSQGGDKLEPIAVRTAGSIECDLRQCLVLARGTDGAVWAGTSCGVFRLDDRTWRSVNRGISTIPGVRERGGLVEVVSLAFAPDRAFAVARGVGLLCGTPPHD